MSLFSSLSLSLSLSLSCVPTVCDAPLRPLAIIAHHYHFIDTVSSVMNATLLLNPKRMLPSINLIYLKEFIGSTKQEYKVFVNCPSKRGNHVLEDTVFIDWYTNICKKGEWVLLARKLVSPFRARANKKLLIHTKASMNPATESIERDLILFNDSCYPSPPSPSCPSSTSFFLPLPLLPFQRLFVSLIG